MTQTDLHVIHHQLIAQFASVLGVRHLLVHQAVKKNIWLVILVKASQYSLAVSTN